MTNEADRNGGIPDAAYSKRVAEAEYRWNHRMEPDPLEGFAGTISFEPKTVIPVVPKSNDVQKNHPCAPKDYNGPVAPDGWPQGEVAPKIPY